MLRSTLIDLDTLFQALQERGFRLLGPVSDDASVSIGEISSTLDLAKGWTAEHQPGHIHWQQGNGDSFFDYASLLDGWKRFVFPAHEHLWNAENSEFRAVKPEVQPLALIGPRACDIAALEILDRVFLQDPVPDMHYEARRESLFIVAVECASAASTCFCSAMGSGPEVRQGADIVLFELNDSSGHRFLTRAASERGRELLETLHLSASSHADIECSHRSLAKVSQATAWPAAGNIPQHAEPVHYQHENWEKIAERCLSCTNCTLVCPTCFCFDLVHGGGVSGPKGCDRQWSSCFDCQHSYIHGGVVRGTIASRYRQWMMHKLVTWHDQFDTSGCVGCGRCISACPAGIDLRQEAERIFTQGKEGQHAES